MGRTRMGRLALVAALAATLAFALPSLAAAATGWVTQQLTLGAIDRGDVDVSGNRVVWTTGDGAFTQVYTWKFGVDATPIAVTTNATPHYGPKVSGDRLVWLESFETGTPLGSTYQVFTIKLGVETTPTRVSVDAYGCSDLGISGDRIVWRQSAGTSDQVYTRKIGVNAAPVCLNAGPSNHRYPAVSGDRVVWLQDTTDGSGGYYQVWTWKSEIATQITYDAHEHYLAGVSGDRIVWEAGTANGENHIFTRKMGKDLTPIQLSTGATTRDDPSVSGDRVIWYERRDSDSLCRVFTRKVGTDSSPKTASPLVLNLSVPELSGDRLVWSNRESAVPRILTRKIGVDTTSTLLASGNNVQGYKVSGDRVAWLQEGVPSGFHQIVFAKKITKPSVVRSPNASTITVKLKSGVAKYTLSATIKDADGTLLAGKRVYLQTSSNGSTRWKNTYSFTTNAAGKVSKALSWRSRGTRYYRWYSTSSTGYLTSYASRQKIVVR